MMTMGSKIEVAWQEYIAVESRDKKAYQSEDYKKSYRESGLLSCWARKIAGKKVFSLLTKINREQRQHEIELASAEETTSKQRFWFQDFHRDI